jgi:hypothetical protein
VSNRTAADYWGRPVELRHLLAARRLLLAAFAYATPSGFTDPAQHTADMDGT